MILAVLREQHEFALSAIGSVYKFQSPRVSTCDSQPARPTVISYSEVNAATTFARNKYVENKVQ
jgi:hypothetical protein